MRALLIPLLLISAHALAQDQALFKPPQAYDIGRYEAGWNKNPFTLKTASLPVANAMFAKDLAIGAFYGSMDDPTIVLVNTKTHERLRLKKGQRTNTGITLQVVNLGVSRSEASVEIHSGDGDSALVKFDEAYLRQVAANAAKNTPAPQSPPPPPQTPVMPVRNAGMSPRKKAGGPAVVINIPPVPEALRGILPPSAFAESPSLENFRRASETATTQPPSTLQATPPASASQTSTAPTVQRRRSITAARY